MSVSEGLEAQEGRGHNNDDGIVAVHCMFSFRGLEEVKRPLSDLKPRRSERKTGMIETTHVAESNEVDFFGFRANADSCR